MGNGKRPPGQTQKALTPDELARERWLPIADWPGYEVSDMGRVRSWKRSVSGRPRGENWIVDYSRPPTMRRASLVKGYRAVTLSNREAGQALVKVSRLVLLAFVGASPDGYEAAHWNGRRTDDRLDNLRWATPKQNGEDKVRHGTAPRGRTHPLAKLTPKKVAALRRDWASGLTHEQLAKRYRISCHTARKITRGETWRHVASPPSTPKSRRRLSAEDVGAIQRRKASGETLQQLADAFGKSVRTIWLAVHKGGSQ